jgi:hypothetical protein
MFHIFIMVGDDEGAKQPRTGSAAGMSGYCEESVLILKRLKGRLRVYRWRRMTHREVASPSIRLPSRLPPFALT